MSAAVVDLASRRAGRRLMLSLEGRSEDFIRGVEIGMLAAALRDSPREHHANLHMGNRELAEEAARGWGYEVAIEPGEEGWILATFTRRR